MRKILIVKLNIMIDGLTVWSC